MSNLNSLPETLHTIFSHIDPQALQQFTDAYQHWTLLQRIDDLEQQIASLQEDIAENKLQLQWAQPSAIALAAIARFQAYGVEDLDLLDTMLERGETWLDRSLQLLEECERLNLIGDSYTVWCQNALDGAFDWIESMLFQSPQTFQSPETGEAPDAAPVNLSTDAVPQNELAQQDALLSALKAILIEAPETNEKLAKETNEVPAEINDAESTQVIAVVETFEDSEISAIPAEAPATTEESREGTETSGQDTASSEVPQAAESNMEPVESAPDSEETLPLAALADHHVPSVEGVEHVIEPVEMPEDTVIAPVSPETPEMTEEAITSSEISGSADTVDIIHDLPEQPQETETATPEEENMEPAETPSEQIEADAISSEIVENPLTSESTASPHEGSEAADVALETIPVMEADDETDVPDETDVAHDASLEQPETAVAHEELVEPADSTENDGDFTDDTLQMVIASDDQPIQMEQTTEGQPDTSEQEDTNPVAFVEAEPASGSEAGSIVPDDIAAFDDQFTEPRLAAYSTPMQESEAVDDSQYIPAQSLLEEQEAPLKPVAAEETGSDETHEPVEMQGAAADASHEPVEEGEEDYTDLLSVDGTVTYLPSNEAGAGGNMQSAAPAGEPKRGFFLWRLFARLFRRSPKTPR